jgi:hypothetical protein
MSYEAISFHRVWKQGSACIFLSVKVFDNGFNIYIWYKPNGEASLYVLQTEEQRQEIPHHEVPAGKVIRFVILTERKHNLK